MAQIGDDILIYADSVSVGGQTGASIARNQNIVDVSSKDDLDRRVLPARRSSTVTLDALYVETDTGLDALRDAVEDGDSVSIKMYNDGVLKRTATGYVASVNEDFPSNAPCTVSITIEIDNNWT